MFAAVRTCVPWKDLDYFYLLEVEHVVIAYMATIPCYIHT